MPRRPGGIKFELKSTTADLCIALPLPVENLQLVARCDDGNVTIESVSGTTGPAKFAAQAHLDLPTAHLGAEPAKSNLAALHSQVEASGDVKTPHPDLLFTGWLSLFRSLDFRLTHWPVTAETFDRLPASFAVYRQRFAPTGTLDVAGKFARTPAGWAGLITLLPTDMSFRFDSFPYPLRDVRGPARFSAGGRSPAPPRCQFDGRRQQSPAGDDSRLRGRPRAQSGIRLRPRRDRAADR